LVRKSSAPVFLLVERRDHDNGNVGRLGVGLQLFADLETVDAGHHHVEQHHIDRHLAADLQALVAVFGRQHLEILGHQPGFEQLHIGGDVIDDENARGHKNRFLRRRPDRS